MKNEKDGIIARVRAGDDAAFTELCLEYDPLIRSMASKYAHMSEADDEDQVLQDFSQDATLALYRAAKTFEYGNGEVSFGLYAKICIRNALVSELRRMRRKRRADRMQEKQMSEGVNPQNVRTNGSTVGLERFTEGELLSSFEKKVLTLYAGGMKVRDIAVATGRNSKSVSNAVYRIKTKVRLSLGEDNK